MARMQAMQAMVAAASLPAAIHRPPASCRCQITCKSSASGMDFVRFHPFQSQTPSLRAPMHIAFDSSDSHTGSTSEGPQPADSVRSLAPLSNSNPFQPLSKDVAMGLVFQAASGTGWTTDSGLEGPAFSDASSKEKTNSSSQWPQLTKSPRRRMRVAFTCNVCGERTMRAINPHAYTDGTVFVQCKGCDVFHKLVDNLNLFYEWDGRVYKANTKSIPPTGKFYRFMHTDDEIPSDDDENPNPASWLR